MRPVSMAPRDWFLCFVVAISIACGTSNTSPPSLLDAHAPWEDAAASPDAGSTRDLDAAALDATPVSDEGGQQEPDAEALRTDGLTISTRAGTLVGKLEGSTRLFLGIPYGAPPVGELRFRPSLPAAPFAGLREAYEFGPACMQAPARGATERTGMSEDCLHLSVFAPTQPAKPRPVMVWLFGGGFMSGKADYPAQWLSRAGDVVVVLVNARVGALSWLTHSALDEAIGQPSGNLALYDQQLALRWVQENIASFGGDPRQVTLFGQSSGAMSACLHMFAKGSEGLAQRFILQSGSCSVGYGAPRSKARMQEVGRALVDKLCGSADDLYACLRDAPAEAFSQDNYMLETLVGWWPHVDGKLIEHSPARLLAEGKVVDAPVLLGTNHDEYGFDKFKNGLPPVGGRIELSARVLASYPDQLLPLLEHYTPANDAEANDAYIRLSTDGNFRCPARSFARALSARGATVFLYDFALRPAVHSMELDFVFGWPENGPSRDIVGAPYPTLTSLVSAVQSYWTQFARTGDPNRDQMPRWPNYRMMDDAHLHIDDPLSVQSQLGAGDCELWEKIYASEAN